MTSKLTGKGGAAEDVKKPLQFSPITANFELRDRGNYFSNSADPRRG